MVRVCGLMDKERKDERMTSSVTEGENEPVSSIGVESSWPTHSQNKQAAALSAPVGPYAPCSVHTNSVVEPSRPRTSRTTSHAPFSSSLGAAY